MKRFRLGFDIGGTFTDFALLDTQTGAWHVHKQLTTPHDPSLGVISGLQTLLAQVGISAAALETAVHGTTLVANTLIERTGAKVALLTTQGHRDVLAIRHEQRYDIYDLFLQYPEPLAPRYLRFGVGERTERDGHILVTPDERALHTIAAQLRTEDIEALAIAFLHAFRNPQNEQVVARFMTHALPNVSISLSSEVAPEIREYERTSTTVANAYVQPKLRAYLQKLEQLLHEMGYAGRLYLLLSSGGNASVRTAAEFPIRLVESGPAAGAVAAAHFGNLAGQRDLISFDMGGTTAKICVIDDGRPTLTRELEVARLQRFRKGSGIPLQFPSIDMIEIGAGGGSIAQLDRLGLLKVGPASAGAEPGPACYGLGGVEPTVTDANLLLGYLNPDYFLGGKMRLDVAAAERAIAKVAQPLGMSLIEAAWGIHQLVNEQMAAAAKIHIIEKARDPRRYAILAYGGGGPLHGMGIAHILSAPAVICPLGAGVASAMGLLLAPLSFEIAQSYPVRWDNVDPQEIETLLMNLQHKGELLLAEATPPPRSAPSEGEGGLVQVERTADGRFVGQLHQLTIPIPTHALTQTDVLAIREIFMARYQERYGHLPPHNRLEFLSWQVKVTAASRAWSVERGASATPSSAMAVSSRERDGVGVGKRRAYFGAEYGFVVTPVYDRYALASDIHISGPAIIEERESTAIVPPNAIASVDAHGNLLMRWNA